jgi:DNA polymerase V
MAAAKLRKQKSHAKALLVFLETNRFRNDLPQNNRHTVITMPVATNSSLEILHYVSKALERIYIPGYKYKKTGVMLMDISSEEAYQMNLWDNIDRDKHKRLMEVLDRTNEKWGRNSLKPAILGDGQQWKIKQERLSPCYTTRMSDFPITK